MIGAGQGPARRQHAFRRGQDAESMVAAEFVREGWTVLSRNWRCPGGELDLVIANGGRLRFVEVKARQPDSLGDGLESVTPAKQRRLRRASSAWLDAHPSDWVELAFMVVVVTLDDAAGWTADVYDDPFDG